MAANTKCSERKQKVNKNSNTGVTVFKEIKESYAQLLDKLGKFSMAKTLLMEALDARMALPKYSDFSLFKTYLLLALQDLSTGHLRSAQKYADNVTLIRQWYPDNVTTRVTWQSFKNGLPPLLEADYCAVQGQVRSTKAGCFMRDVHVVVLAGYSVHVFGSVRSVCCTRCALCYALGSGI
eukprot:3801702-Rhodomonas_salina.1